MILLNCRSLCLSADSYDELEEPEREGTRWTRASREAEGLMDEPTQQGKHSIRE
jgi:hypothetical protein